MRVGSQRLLQALVGIGLILLINQMAAAYGDSSQYLYTASNNIQQNEIYGYKVLEGGGLEPLPGSPYATGGAGNGMANFSQDGVIASEDGRFLFTVNPGSNDISVFRVKFDGSLTPVVGSPFPSGGMVPLSLAKSGSVLYVSHGGPNASVFGNSSQPCIDCDYQGFRVSFGGSLEPIEGSKIDLEIENAAYPLAIKFNPKGDVLLGTRFAFAPFQFQTRELLTFKLNKKTGLLTPAPGSPYLSGNGANQPIGFAFNPVNPTQVYVANGVSDDPILPSNVSTWLMAETGQIAQILNSPTPVSGAGLAIATCWIVSLSHGETIIASNTLSDNISLLSVSDGGETSLITSTRLPNLTPGFIEGPADIAITPDDQYLYSLQTLTGSILGWQVDEVNGLVELESQPDRLPLGSTPFGMVIVDKLAIKPWLKKKVWSGAEF